MPDGNGQPRIERMALASLTPAKYNPRRMSAEARAGLAASIERWGCVEPIVVNRRSGRVVGGHQRLAVLQERGVGEAQVVVVDLPDDEERALNVALNNQAIAGEWDWGKLAATLPQIVEMPDLDAALLGFDALGAELLANLPDEPGDGLTDPDAVPEPPGEPVTRPGDLWLLGEHRLVCGDCRDAGVVEGLMGGEEAAMLWSDPPYGKGGYAGRSGKHDPVRGDNAADVRPFFAVGTAPEAYVCCDYATYGNLLATRGVPRSLIVWAKQGIGLGHGYRRQHEFIGYWGTFASSTETDLWQIARGSSYVHPTEKPVALPERAIRNSTKRDAMVLAPFAGSGGEIIACEQLGRRCRAVEIEPAYVDVSLARWAAFSGGDPVREDGAKWSALLAERERA